jgi:hypothetical protein
LIDQIINIVEKWTEQTIKQDEGWIKWGTMALCLEIENSCHKLAEVGGRLIIPNS